MKIEKQTTADAAVDAALAAGLTGGVLGGTSRLLSGARELAPIMRSALLGGGMMGGLAGGATALGSAILGAPKDTEEGAYTRRGLTGGLIGGAAVGGAGGAMLGALGNRALRGIPKATQAFAKSELPLDNLIVDAIKRWMSRPGTASSAKTGALLGAVTGLAGGGVGASEGMGLDYYKTELDRL